MSKEYEAEHRQAVIDGLRELADFLTEHPDVPVSGNDWITYYPSGTDEEERAEVDQVAAILGATAGLAGSPDHYVALREFSGGITYKVIAITADHMRRHAAAQTYSGAVEPEAVPAS